MRRVLLDIRFEFGETQFLEEVSRTVIRDNSAAEALPFNQMSVDQDPATGQWGVVHSYQLPTEGYVLWSWLDLGEALADRPCPCA